MPDAQSLVTLFSSALPLLLIVAIAAYSIRILRKSLPAPRRREIAGQPDRSSGRGAPQNTMIADELVHDAALRRESRRRSRSYFSVEVKSAAMRQPAGVFTHSTLTRNRRRSGFTLAPMTS